MTKTVRPARQLRSREGWERALAIASELFQEGGYEALSISEVCRRAGMSAPSLYARVDGLDGLFRAVFEQGMREVSATEDELLAATDGPPVEAMVAAVSGIFTRHEAFLRAVIRRSTADPVLLAEGARRSRALTKRVADALPGDPEARRLAARTLYTECAFRVIYGERFWDPKGESADQFRAKLVALTEHILAPAGH